MYTFKRNNGKKRNQGKQGSPKEGKIRRTGTGTGEME